MYLLSLLYIFIVMECFSPQSVMRPGQDNSRDRVVVPCGKCTACLSTKRIQWSVRLREQLKTSFSAYFVTLTYATPPKDGVNKYDVQCYMKRLRKRFKVPFKYYLCAEYGSQTHRPHYHFIVLFSSKPELYFSRSVEDVFVSAWSHGFVSVGTVTDASIAYTTKYMISKSFFPEGLTPPFHLVSKGLGKDYVSYMKQWHQDDVLGRSYVPLFDGVHASMPRYYKDKIYTDVQRRMMSSRYQTERLVSLPDESVTRSGDNVFQLADLSKQAITRRVYNQLNKRKL
ncbi:MAG: hypothetical protein LBF69_05595 [Prevotellaceae bacterium]|jgi:hypothetical protein|nr:hypothetical protein [Prevotellaceae bacterium]